MWIVGRRMAIFGGFCSVFAFGWGLAMAQTPCPAVADYHLKVFDSDPMEVEDASELMENPCTGAVEIVSIDFKPGLGFIQSFKSGDVYAEVDPFVLLQCIDGRAMVKNVQEKKLICDTR
jgi:hypothetical protein